MTKQLTYADSNPIPFVAMEGEKEMKEGTITHEKLCRREINNAFHKTKWWKSSAREQYNKNKLRDFGVFCFMNG